MTVAILFARADSIYKAMPGCDVWDIERDARRWPGGAPIVAHPPCRAWGRMRHFARPREDERALGLLAVDWVREWGGVLEHPASSSLWLHRCLPAPGAGPDLFGGWTLPVSQKWWGHEAEKATWMYVVGVGGRSVPAIPLTLGPAPKKCAARSGFTRGMPGWRPDMKTAQREKTPPEFAQWLVTLARSAVRP